jgi:hypothetical protein
MEQQANPDSKKVRVVADLEKDLHAIEQHLHSAEQKYLESTGHGNVMKGWKELLTVGKINTRRKDRVDPRDKVWRCSSYRCICTLVYVSSFFIFLHLTKHTTHTHSHSIYISHTHIYIYIQVFSASSVTAPDFDGRKQDNSSDSDSSD